MKYIRIAAYVLAVAAVLGAGLWGLISGTGESQIPPTPTSNEVTIQKWVRSVTVQVLINMDKYTRPLTWYQEVTATGEKGEWKVRYGDWSKDPERVVVAGTGVIVYSLDGDLPGTYILTNAHVVEPLVNKASLGSRYAPLDLYDLKDLEIKDLPPSIKIKDGARPIAQYYFTLPTEYAQIKHTEDQFYTVYAKVVDFDMALDVALLQVCTPQGQPARVWGLPYATFRDTGPFVGESVWLCGAPLAIPFSIDRGRVNQVRLDLGSDGEIVWNRQVKLDIAAAPGHSGSGIFDEKGYLIAELHGTLVYAGNYIRGGTLAIDGALIREWLLWRGWAFIVTAPPYQGAPYYKPSQ